MKKVSYNDANIKIQVVPKFLPDGEEDMTEMIIGVRTYKDRTSSVIKVQIYRKVHEVICLYEDCSLSTQKFNSEDEVINMTVDVPFPLPDKSKIVTTGDGTMRMGQCLGLYSYDPKDPV